MTRLFGIIICLCAFCPRCNDIAIKSAATHQSEGQRKIQEQIIIPLGGF